MCCREKKTYFDPRLPINLSARRKNYLNICLIGDSGVGKTCLVSRFAGASFPDMTVMTVMNDVSLNEHVMDNGETISIRLWDTAGQERFKALTKMNLRYCEAAILVYDESVPKTVEYLKTIWYPLLKESSPQLRFLLVVGNKNDILCTAQTHEEVATNLAAFGEICSSHRPAYISISAKADDTRSCLDVYHQFCTKILKDIKETEPGHYKEFLLI
jgi:small GTP-binding protein